jgi:uncharacterized protein (TIGR03435 family)
MLRAMLEDRFAVQARIGTKQMSVTALRVKTPDKLGPAIRPSSAECTRVSTESSAAGASPGCPPPDLSWGIEATAVTMAELADILSKRSRFQFLRPLIDQTGRPGTYDVSFSLNKWLPKYKWTADDLRGVLSEQLGVKLEPTSLPFPALIIEKAKRPQVD